MKAENKLLAEFMGMTYEKNIGWYDNQMMLEQIVYDLNDGNCFDELQFETSWDWLMPVVSKITKDEKYLENEYRENLMDIVPYGQREDVYNAVVEFINEYNKNK
tara:strand:+ start:44 stop:355 length:312 start_codon:yes stop_codon:yes gene_type:complete